MQNNIEIKKMVEYYEVAIATAITTKKLIHDYSIWYGICKVPFFYLVPLDDNNTEQQQQLTQMKTEPLVAEPSRIIKQKTEQGLLRPEEAQNIIRTSNLNFLKHLKRSAQQGDEVWEM